MSGQLLQVNKIKATGLLGRFLGDQISYKCVTRACVYLISELLSGHNMYFENFMGFYGSENLMSLPLWGFA